MFVKDHFCVDYVCGGELFTHLHQIGPFTEDQAKVYGAEVTLALEHLHNVSWWVWLAWVWPATEVTLALEHPHNGSGWVWLNCCRGCRGYKGYD